MFHHDYTYCSDYDTEKCSKTCFRAEITQELRDEMLTAADASGTAPLLISWSHFKNTKECPIHDTYNLQKVVYCSDCKFKMYSDFYLECSKGILGIVAPNDYCSRGQSKYE